jgi:hypothetical protein
MNVLGVERGKLFTLASLYEKGNAKYDGVKSTIIEEKSLYGDSYIISLV